MKADNRPATGTISRYRRRFLQMLGIFGLGAGSTQLRAHHTDTHFEDESPHKMVFQLNKADTDYIDAILFASGELIRKYGDDIEIVIAALGPGIHLLARHPGRPIKEIHKQRVTSLAAYGVSFMVCGNTMKSLDWTEKDMLDIVKIVPIGTDGIMQLQEKGFSYISW